MVLYMVISGRGGGVGWGVYKDCPFRTIFVRDLGRQPVRVASAHGLRMLIRRVVLIYTFHVWYSSFYLTFRCIVDTVWILNKLSEKT